VRSGEMHVRGGLFRAGINETGLTAVQVHLYLQARRAPPAHYLRIQGVEGLGCRMQGAGFRVQGPGFRVQG
jgi:hypothetical protein